MTQMIELSQISYDPKFYPRVNGHPDWMTVLRYSDTLQADPGMEFDPITVVKSMVKKNPFNKDDAKVPFCLLDGLHRTRSYIKAGREEIPAVIERLPQSKWMERSVELNSTHGRALDNGDKSWIGVRLKEEGWKVEDVAKLLHMKTDSLEKMMAERCVKITAKMAETLPEGRSNRQVNGDRIGFLKAPLIKANGKANVEAALESQHSVSSHDVASILDSMISILKSGVVNMAEENIAAQVGVIKKLLRKL